jgi:hypothetical protein
MEIRPCCVTIADMDGVAHTVEVTRLQGSLRL